MEWAKQRDLCLLRRDCAHVMLADARRRDRAARCAARARPCTVTPVSRHTLVHTCTPTTHRTSCWCCRVGQADSRAVRRSRADAGRCAAWCSRRRERAALRAALDAGVHAWVSTATSASGWDAVLRLARARGAARCRGARRARRTARAARRAQVDRARQGRADERAPHRRRRGLPLLRGAVDARAAARGRGVARGDRSSQRANAINRAGQLRMLSQRIVGCSAQRLRASRRAQAATLLAIARTGASQLAHSTVSARRSGGRRAGRSERRVAGLEPALEPRRQHAPTSPRPTARPARCSMPPNAWWPRSKPAAACVRCGSSTSVAASACARNASSSWRVGAAPNARRPRSGGGDPVTRPSPNSRQALDELEGAPLTSPDMRAGLLAAREEWLRLLRGVREAPVRRATPRWRTAASACSTISRR